MKLVGMIVVLLALAFPALGQSLTDLESSIGFDLGIAGISTLVLGLSAAHILAPGSYDARVNTISDLGAQGYSRAWVMRSTFLASGLLVATGSVTRFLGGSESVVEALPLAVYGLSLAATGVWSCEPFDGSPLLSQNDANLHSLFAAVAGFALTGAIVVEVIQASTFEERMIHLAALVFVPACSAMFALQPENQGIWQRVLWAGSLTWLAWSMTL
jgi:hypothetical membrane protein